MTQTTTTEVFSEYSRAAKIERARRAFGDALSTRVNMDTRLGDVPVQAIREAIAEALEAANVI